jgi:putative ABC transport system permease protein
LVSGFIQRNTNELDLAMRRWFEIIRSGIRMALEEVRKNKLRTFLSLFGVTIGIFCIIGVLATVNSLETNIRNEIKALGNNTIYIDKWEWGAGPEYPFWKYARRPLPRFSEMQEIKLRTPAAKHTSFFISSIVSVEARQQVISNMRLYGITEEYPQIQPVEIRYGRMLSITEMQKGVPVTVIGNEVAEQLFGDPADAVGKQLRVKGRTVAIAGVIRKQGSQLIGGWQFDKSMLLPYDYCKAFMEERRSAPLIIVKGADNITSKVLKDELSGVMRAVRKLGTKEPDNFSLNDVNDFGTTMSRAFVSINMGGWVIGALAFIVGIFGVANIMFVTVKERTSQIGLKKAVGARSREILAEFLLESAALCIIGGLIGLLLIFILTQVVTYAFDFPLFLSPNIIALALFICITAGVVAGIIPAAQAAKMDPVKAIRS